MKTAIVVGHRGQDGTYLSNFLRQQNYLVIGFDKYELKWGDTICDKVINLLDYIEIEWLLKATGPTEIYYLAAYHTSSEKSKNTASLYEEYHSSQAVNVNGLVNFLSAMVKFSNESRLFYAASSLIFSGLQGETQNEHTQIEPTGIYGITKAQGLWLCREFREKYGVYASTGILYNHESGIRPASFLTSKIIKAAINISNGKLEKIIVGNLEIRVDWGLAKDYVIAFKEILNLNISSEYIIASGETHSVEEFISEVFDYFSLDWKNYVEVVPDLIFRKALVKRGDVSKLKKHTGLTLSRPFKEFVSLLIQEHLEE
jgi:GDPmannose 4,6-dehydratase